MLPQPVGACVKVRSCHVHSLHFVNLGLRFACRDFRIQCRVGRGEADSKCAQAAAEGAFPGLRIALLDHRRGRTLHTKLQHAGTCTLHSLDFRCALAVGEACEAQPRWSPFD